MSALPVNATALFLSLTLVDESGKKYRLNISSPNTVSLSLQAVEDTNGSVVDLASSDGEAGPTNLTGGTEDDPLTVESSDSSDSDSSESADESCCGSSTGVTDELAQPEEAVVAEEPEPEDTVVAEDPEPEDPEPEEENEVVQPFARAPVRLQAIPRPPLNTVNGFGVRRSARTRGRTLHFDESDSEDEFDMVAGFSQEIFSKKRGKKSNK